MRKMDERNVLREYFWYDYKDQKLKYWRLITCQPKSASTQLKMLEDIAKLSGDVSLENYQEQESEKL